MYFVNTAQIFKEQMCITLDFYYVDANFHQVAWFDPCLKPEMWTKVGFCGTEFQS